jgi:NitT/TauT family transport system substrate-binding protein
MSYLAKDRLRTLHDLSAAVIGVTDLGSQAHWFINYIASIHGITPDSLGVLAVGMQVNAVAALERGRIDVSPGFEPGITRFLIRHPEASILADARSPEGLTRVVESTTYPGAVLYASADWLEANADKARRLGRAVRTSLQWIQEHSPDEILSKVPDGYTGADKKVYLHALRNSYEMYSPDGLMPPLGPEIAFEVLSASVPELRGESFDLKDTWTNAFIQN